MFRSDPTTELLMYQSRERELERKLTVARLMAEAGADETGLWTRLLSRVGDALIGLGLRLKGCYESVEEGSSTPRSIESMLADW
jgi:hypothetical protein